MDALNIVSACGLILGFVAMSVDEFRALARPFICPKCNFVVADPQVRRWQEVLKEALREFRVCPAGHKAYRAFSFAAGFARGALMALALEFFTVALVALARNRALVLAWPIGAIALAWHWRVRARELSANGSGGSELGPGWRGAAIGLLVGLGVLALILVVQVLSHWSGPWFRGSAPGGA